MAGWRADPDGQEAAGHGGARVVLAGLVPCRHVTAGPGACARASWRKVAGGEGRRAWAAGRARRRAGLRDGVPWCALVLPLTATRTASRRGQLLAEQGVIAVADVGGHHRPGGAVTRSRSPSRRAGHLWIMSSASRHFSRCAPHRDAGPLAARAARRPTPPDRPARVIPACGQNSRQSAAQEARSFTRCTLTATGSSRSCRACRSTAGPRTARRPVLGEPGVIDHQRLHRLAGREPPRTSAAPRVIPGRGRDERCSR